MGVTQPEHLKTINVTRERYQTHGEICVLPLNYLDYTASFSPM